MTVEKLIEELKKFPPDALVVYADGDYNGSYSSVNKVENEKHMGVPQNSVQLA